PDAWPGVVAFLDGVQRSEVVGYVGSAPIILADVAAAVRERRDRTLRTAAVGRRTVAIGRPAALEALEGELPAADLIQLPNDEPTHPVRDLNAAARLVDQARGALEVAIGRTYRDADATSWLVIDGSLGQSPHRAADAFALGVVKSHLSLPFEGEELERYLRLPHAHRTSIFAPASHHVAPVRAWALRLWPWEGRDLFHGLVRIEVAPANGNPASADRISRWLLAERAPISAPDPRWDRLLYGIHSVEQYLRASR
nr:hypothetical protein [Gemmatimonadales bacterium]